MDSAILSVIFDEARRVFPREACGVVVKSHKRGRAVPCKNVAADPSKFFVIDPLDYAQQADQGDILAIWHTHPNLPSHPSGADLAGCEASGLEWIIVGVSQRAGEFVFEEPVVIQPTGAIAPYLERPYLPGIHDCYGLARDYYKQEFGIALRQYLHTERWWDEGGDMLNENFRDEDFVELPYNSAPHPGDVFLIQSFARVPNHVAIYVGDDTILHHCFERLSRRDIYGGSYWQKHTTHHLRHKSKC